MNSLTVNFRNTVTRVLLDLHAASANGGSVTRIFGRVTHLVIPQWNAREFVRNNAYRLPAEIRETIVFAMDARFEDERQAKQVRARIEALLQTPLLDYKPLRHWGRA